VCAISPIAFPVGWTAGVAVVILAFVVTVREQDPDGL
jgi:hypothetical protein